MTAKTTFQPLSGHGLEGLVVLHAASAARVVVGPSSLSVPTSELHEKMSRFLSSLFPALDDDAESREEPDCLLQGASPANDASLSWFANRLMSTPATRAKAVLGPMPGMLRSER